MSHFVVKTDHRPLVGLFTKDMVAIDNPRLVRIRESVLGYVLTVEHVPGKNNAAADALSRYPSGANCLPSTTEAAGGR
jgi:hypothetical protein